MRSPLEWRSSPEDPQLSGARNSIPEGAYVPIGAVDHARRAGSGGSASAAGNTLHSDLPIRRSSTRPRTRQSDHSNLPVLAQAVASKVHVDV